MAGDVFEKDPVGSAFGDDTGDVWPEVSRVSGATAFSGRAEGLTGIPGEDDIERTAEAPGIEAAQIVPDRGWAEVSIALGSDDDSARPSLPFDKGAGVISGFCQHEAHIQASAACAEGQSMPGT